MPTVFLEAFPLAELATRSAVSPTFLLVTLFIFPLVTLGAFEEACKHCNF